MKLLIMQPYLNLRGGVERVILKVAQHYDAKIYTLEYNKKTTFPEFEDIDINIMGKDVPLSKMLPYRASQGLRYGYNFYNMKVKEEYDVLNSHISPSEWIRHNNKRVVWYCHTPPREVYDLYATRMAQRSHKDKLIHATMARVYKIMASGIIKDIEEIATNSATTAERIKKYFSRDATIISPGIDYEKFFNAGYEKFFLYPSRILINKRQDYIINAFKQFVKKTGNKDYKLILAGTLSKDPEHSDYLNKIKEMAKGYNIAIKTNVTDKELTNLYSTATAILFAAMNEDFGLVPLESMASSKPIISVNEGGPKETIINGQNGFLVDSATEMAERMAFLSEHMDLAEKMGKKGLQIATKNYSWDVFFKKLDPLLRKVSKEMS